MGVYSTQNVPSIFQEFTSISKQNPQVLSTSSETVPESLIQEARNHNIGWVDSDEVWLMRRYLQPESQIPKQNKKQHKSQKWMEWS